MKLTDYSRRCLKALAVRISSFATIPMAAFFVSLCALFLTIQNYRLAAESAEIDRQYKEASIAPRLSGDVKWSPFGLVVRNVGLGPALITRVVVKYKEDCADSNKLNKWEFFVKSTQIVERWAQEVNVLLPTSIRESNEIMKFGHGALVPGMIVPAKEEYVVLQIQDSAKFEEAMLASHKEGGFAKKLSAFSATIPFRFAYTSLTGRTEPERWIKENECP
jgi:hypothetical protein